MFLANTTEFFVNRANKESNVVVDFVPDLHDWQHFITRQCFVSELRAHRRDYSLFYFQWLTNFGDVRLSSVVLISVLTITGVGNGMWGS